MGPEVVFTNVVVTTIEPLEKTAHVKTIDPTENDMFTLDSYIPVLFAYRLADNSDESYLQLINRMKEGLREVLVPFFPWAGRWIAIPGGRGRQLLCNDKGISFIETCVDKNLDSVVRVSAEYQPVPELNGFSFLGMESKSFRQQMLPDGLPCAFVQVTRFKCGGLVLGVTFNHMLADAKSFSHFMTAWSDLSRTGKTDMILDHNREEIDTSNSRNAPSDPFEGSLTTNGWEMKCYEVSAPVIQSIKSGVKESSDGSYVSTMDCIYAHMWKTVSSLPFSIIGGKEIGMLNVVEGRSKFYDPPVPNLLGNVLTSMSAPKISKAELLQMPLSVIAIKIREKINKASRETWLSPERVAEVLDTFVSDQTLAWQQTSWQSFPIYKTDFGFGNPFFVAGMNIRLSFEMYMLGHSFIGPPTPDVSNSAAFLSIRSTPQVLEALENRPDFLAFFLPATKK